MLCDVCCLRWCFVLRVREVEDGRFGFCCFIVVSPARRRCTCTRFQQGWPCCCRLTEVCRDWDPNVGASLPALRVVAALCLLVLETVLGERNREGFSCVATSSFAGRGDVVSLQEVERRPSVASRRQQDEWTSLATEGERLSRNGPSRRLLLGTC